MDILGKKRLSQRRRQWLAALDAAAHAAGGPVHYSAVSAWTGSSPWTAYDLLRELERAGLAQASYSHRPGVAVGRPQVAFMPTAEGRALLGVVTPAGASPDERALRRARDRVAGGAAALGADLAGHLGFWLHQAEQLPGRTRSGLSRLLSTAPEAAAALTTFVGAVYGGLAPRAADGEDDLLAAVSAFQERLGRTTAARRERLARSVARLLEPLEVRPQLPAIRPASGRV